MIQVVTVLIDKSEVDAALLVEELAEIYSTPTPKGWREAKKEIVLIDWLSVYNGRDPIFIPGT